MEPNCSCGKNVKTNCCKECNCPCYKGSLYKQIQLNSKLGPAIERNDVNYLGHKQRVKNMLAIVDTSPPKLYVNALIKKDVCIEDLQRIKAIMQENKTLLTRMNIICRTKGVIDTYNPYAGRRRSHLKKYNRCVDRIEFENAQLFERILKTKPVIINKELAKSWQINLKNMRNRAVYPITHPWLQGVDVDEDPAAQDCIDHLRPKVFLDLAVKNGRSIGRIKILLYSDFAPMTCIKFLQLFPNYESSLSSENFQRKATLIGCPINRVFQKLYAEIGDINGIDEEFPIENYTLAAHFIGTVAMMPTEQNMANYKFLITFKPLSILNGKCSVFGRIVKGLNVLNALEGLGRQNGEPRENAIISNCGIIRQFNEFDQACICLDHMKLAKLNQK